jgi:hypothetical protein
VLLCSALNRISPRGVSFLDQSTLIREKLAEQLEREEAWSKAAQVLAGIDLDSGAIAAVNAAEKVPVVPAKFCLYFALRVGAGWR